MHQDLVYLAGMAVRRWGEQDGCRILSRILEEAGEVAQLVNAHEIGNTKSLSREDLRAKLPSEIYDLLRNVYELMLRYEIVPQAEQRIADSKSRWEAAARGDAAK